MITHKFFNIFQLKNSSDKQIVNILSKYTCGSGSISEKTAATHVAIKTKTIK
jgi:hypothetical protein